MDHYTVRAGGEENGGLWIIRVPQAAGSLAASSSVLEAGNEVGLSVAEARI